MIVVITGGAGFIGSNLAHELAARATVDRIRVVDDLSTGSRDNIAHLERNGSVEFLHGSILDPGLLDVALRDADTVVHLAALPSVPRSLLDPLSTHRVNATGTLEVLEAARRAGGVHVIAASSSSVYGRNPRLPKAESLLPEPVSPYAVSKLTTEAYLASYHHSYGLPVLPFRFFNVYGPRQRPDHPYAAVIPKFLRAALAGEAVTINGDGSQTRDFTYVGTVVRALAVAIEGRLTSSEPVNLAFGTRTSLTELTVLLQEVLKRRIAVRHARPRPGDVADSQADTARMHRLLPALAPTPLASGLRLTADWLMRSTSNTADVRALC